MEVLWQLGGFAVEKIESFKIMFISVVIPVYNEKGNILTVCREIKDIISKLNFRKKVTCEIIIVDDHSEDMTSDFVKKILDKKIKIIRLNKRSGSHVALRAGIDYSKGDMVLCLAADGQDNPEMLQTMINKILRGQDIVWAVRKNRDEPFFQKFLAEFFYKILDMGNDNEYKINVTNADFFLMNRKFVDAVKKCRERNTSLFGLLIWLGFKQDFVFYERRKRFVGESKWNFKSRLNLAKDWIIAFSGLPLKIIMIFGFIMAFLGLGYAFFIFFYAILGYSKPGWAESVIIVLISSGVQMIMIGVIGEYLWRNLDETRNRPLYFIESIKE